ncbi:hypothetical protein MVEN_01347700 [Mycena venus]|uniref:Uncharacterized protein n=1 Tax=Mycena venus TaxID=2733690 RepID=A0A8H7CW67_9AGAR|nr:hypothetical protein MVEN_01347700 [Mycena venus]
MTAQLAIYSLPDKLLIAIAAAGQEGRVADLRPGTSKTEWALSHVSCRGSDTIVGVSALWTLVESNLDASESVEILNLYLERSRSCNISAIFHRSTVLEYNLLRERLSQAIIPHVNRIWSLKIVLNTQWEAEYLEFVNDYTNHEYEWSTIEMFSCGAPRLGFLKMDRFLREPHDSGDPSNNSLLVVLTAQCPLLVYLHLDMIWFPNVMIPNICWSYLIDLFNTPDLTEFIIDGAHGDQIFVLLNSQSLPRPSFPALTSFFINTKSCFCETDPALSHAHLPFLHTISFPALVLFPALSSLTLVRQCFTRNLVKYILGPTSQPWSQLKTLTLCPKEDTSDSVCDALKDAIASKRQHGQCLPKLRLSAALFSLEDWQVGGVDVEIFDLVHLLNSGLL